MVKNNPKIEIDILYGGYGFRENEIEDIRGFFQQDIFDIKARERGICYDMSPDVATIIIAFSLKAFYTFSEGFFDEMGKDAWKSLKNGFKKIRSHHGQVKRQYNPLTLILRIKIEAPYKDIGVIIPIQDEKSMEKALDILLEFIEGNRHEVESIDYTTYLSFNPESEKWYVGGHGE